jgi:N-acetylmuramoyl-L-alanine amidase
MCKEENSKRRGQRILVIILALALIINGNFFIDAYAAEYKAAIGETQYETLEQAVAAVAEGQTIRLLRPVEIGPEDETGIINRTGVSFFIDLGDQTISGAQADPILQIIAGNPTIYNGQIVNQQEGGLAVSVGEESDASIAFPIGYPVPEPMAGQLDIPVAYHLDFTVGSNGTIRYGTETGLQVPLSAGNLYAGESAVHRFHFVPNVGYEVKTITINGVAQPLAGQITISNLSQDQTIEGSFAKITFDIAPKAFAGDVEANQGVTLSPAKATVEYGADQNFQIVVNQGYRLKDVLVNNVSIGPQTTVTLTNVTTPQTITIRLEKTALFIMLDAGHYEYYNHSPVLSAYYEGNVMWTFHGYLKKELELYPGIIVKTTRPDNTKAIGSALGPWDRGAMGAGYDLVLSLHSNACSTASVDHVVGIYTQDPGLIAVSKGLGAKLTSVVDQVMGTSQTPKIYSKTQSDGRDWYGINRGAASVGTPSLILEHSFHTNLRSTQWLMQDANLKLMAASEAKAIAEYYGVSKDGTMTAPKTPSGFDAYGISYTKNKIRWEMSQGASGYQVYRSQSKYGTYTKVKTTSEFEMIDSGLACGSVYYYKVRAYRTTTAGVKYSAFTAVNPAKPIPTKPVLAALSGVKKANLTWNTISGAHGYQIYRTTGSSGTWTKVKTITTGSVTKWTNSNLSTGKTYTYKVRAYRMVGGKPVFSVCSIPKTVKIK